MNRLTLFFILFSGYVQAGLFSDQALKIGYINIDHVVNSSPQFIDANQRVIKEFKPQEEQLLALSEDLKSLVDKLNTSKDKLSQAQIKDSIVSIKSLEKRIKAKALSLKQKLKEKNNQELGKIQALINQVIAEVAEKEKFDLILYQEVAYASDNVNITKTISQKLKKLNE